MAVNVSCGLLIGDNVTAALGATTGDRVGIDDAGKLVEGNTLGGSVTLFVGRRVEVTFGSFVGDFVVGSCIGAWIGLAVGSSVVAKLGEPVTGTSVGGVVSTPDGLCIGGVLGVLVGTAVKIACGV